METVLKTVDASAPQVRILPSSPTSLDRRGNKLRSSDCTAEREADSIHACYRSRRCICDSAKRSLQSAGHFGERGGWKLKAVAGRG